MHQAEKGGCLLVWLVAAKLLAHITAIHEYHVEGIV